MVRVYEPFSVLTIGADEEAARHRGGFEKVGVHHQFVFDDNPANFSTPPIQEGVARGYYTVVSNLGALTTVPNILDIASTSSAQTLTALQKAKAVYGDNYERLQALLIQNPGQDADKKHGLISFLNFHKLGPKTIVQNEDSASEAVRQVQEFTARQKAAQNKLRGVDVVYYKKLVPEDKDNRYEGLITDPYAEAFQRMVSIAQDLAGAGSNRKFTVGTNNHLKTIDGIPGNEATYVTGKIQKGPFVRLAQGLGMFSIYADGKMWRHNDPGEWYSATAIYKNGSWARAILGPVPHVSDMQATKVTFFEDYKFGREVVLNDDPLQTIIEGVADLALTGEKSEVMKRLSIKRMSQASEFLDTIRKSAKVITGAVTEF